ncbi:DUF2946 family protein [Ottowia thiooxydans]|uniref:DUF2946 family protein n=1 Tax=Ottowia thiooxydans TaxID=219182 RepID=UPI0003FCFB34|nr:DUF2946 family protein [Ottowia thiooxydans]
MHLLRTSSILTRLVLAWFLLMIGVATASPIVQPKATEIVCSAGGVMKIVFQNDDGQVTSNGQHTLDCSLCLAPTLPLAQQRTLQALPSAPSHALKPELEAPVAAAVGAPLPPRGPPVLI